MVKDFWKSYNLRISSSGLTKFKEIEKTFLFIVELIYYIILYAHTCN